MGPCRTWVGAASLGSAQPQLSVYLFQGLVTDRKAAASGVENSDKLRGSLGRWHSPGLAAVWRTLTERFPANSRPCPCGREGRFHQKPFCPCGLGGNFPTAQTLTRRRTFQPPPAPRHSLSPSFLPGSGSSWSAGPAPAALYSTLSSHSSLYSRLSMDRSWEHSRLPTWENAG